MTVKKQMTDASSSRPEVTFVVPCYNESANISGVITEIDAAAAAIGMARYEINIVDDCSTDDSAKVVAAHAVEKPYVKLIRNQKNMGFGGAYKEGVKLATGTYVIMVPGDNAHPHGSLIPILRKAGEADIIIPYVTNPETRSWRRRAVSFAFTTLMNTLFRLNVPYFNGTVLHKTDLLKSIEIQTNSFAYQADALIRLIQGGATYASVGVEIEEPRDKATTAFRPRNIYRVVHTIFSLWRVVGTDSRPSPLSIET
jgi:glycosyltransferase involved in cell wall biosynthesis